MTNNEINEFKSSKKKEKRKLKNKHHSQQSILQMHKPWKFEQHSYLFPRCGGVCKTYLREQNKHTRNYGKK